MLVQNSSSAELRRRPSYNFPAHKYAHERAQTRTHTKVRRGKAVPPFGGKPQKVPNAPARSTTLVLQQSQRKLRITSILQRTTIGRS